MSGEVIECEPLKPIALKGDKEIMFFEMVIKSYAPTYFNYADTPLIEIYAKTLSELDTLYAALAMAGNISDEKNNRYEKISRLIDTKIKSITKLGSSLRINPQQRRAAGNNRIDNPEDAGRTPKGSERDDVTHQEIWNNEPA